MSSTWPPPDMEAWIDEQIRCNYAEFWQALEGRGAHMAWPGQYNSAETKRVFQTLEKYYLALEDNTASRFKPDPFYRWKKGTPPDVAALLKAIDDDIYAEMYIDHAASWKSYDAAPEMSRLLGVDGGAPALALAQELDEALD